VWGWQRSGPAGTALQSVRFAIDLPDSVRVDNVSVSSGRELFYVSRSDELWSAAVATSPAFAVRERKKLFALPAGVRPNASSARFDVAPGDQRFLMIRSVAETGGEQRAKVVLVMNVLDELKTKAGAKK